MKFFDIEWLEKKCPGCKYYIFFGLRSNGKTTSILRKIVKNFFKNGKCGAILRRWKEDFKGKRAASLFDTLISDANGHNHIKELSKGKYDRVTYLSGRWFMAYYDEELEKVIAAPEPFCFAFALTEMEHDKGQTYGQGNITTVFLDEFMTHGMYLPDEFVLFCNVLSSIARHRNDLTVYMAANTVDFNGIGCPYIREMGLKNVKNMKPGDTEVYKYGDSGLQVAVMYCDSQPEGKPSDIYFAFDNRNLKLNMITDGSWELDIFPHVQKRVEKTEIIFSYFIIFEEYIMQADIVQRENEAFTYIHPKTTPIKYEDKDVIFTTDANPQYNYFGKLTKPINKAVRKLYWFFVANKVFYSGNDVGEIVARYIHWCNNSK